MSGWGRGAAIAGVALGASVAAAAGPTGAIFTTMPDGGIVNANVQYDDKRQVYLDGGPGQNAPSTAAGLDEGCYVFQVTDPSGANLLSTDPSKCRVVRVNERGVIAELVKPSELQSKCPGVDGPPLSNSYPGGGLCREEDTSRSAMGQGPHDTNDDVDHEDVGAITVQLYPFNDTPNPGGVYKAWMEKLPSYLAKGGGSIDNLQPLERLPRKNNSAKKYCPQGCFFPDAGFGAPRNDTKTDNFKVKGVPPRIEVVKYDDLKADGDLDPEDELVNGWPILVIEHLPDGSTLERNGYTPVDMAVPRNTPIEVCEQFPPSDPKWHFSFVYIEVNGTPVYQTAYDKNVVGIDYKCVSFTSGSDDVTTEFGFGNWYPASKSGYKFKGDPTGTSTCAEKCGGEPIEGWTICLLDSSGAVEACTQTSADGHYEFEDLTPGSYLVCEEDVASWDQKFPNTVGPNDVGDEIVDVCAGFGPYAEYGYGITLTSGEQDENNNFCNATITGCTRTFGYWKTDGSDPQPHTWPAGYARSDEFFSSDQTWQECLDTEASVAPGYYQLAHQYIAAVLNRASGASVPSGVQTIIGQAATWFGSHFPDDCAGSDSCAEQKSWASALDSYNNGLYSGGPSHCN